jgi:hypothetical protein
MGRKASFTEEQKKEIRTKTKAGENPVTEYKVSRGTIYNVIKETESDAHPSSYQQHTPDQ